LSIIKSITKGFYVHLAGEIDICGCRPALIPGFYTLIGININTFFIFLANLCIIITVYAAEDIALSVCLSAISMLAVIVFTGLSNL